jgi:FkbM family methyltransferase
MVSLAAAGSQGLSLFALIDEYSSCLIYGKSMPRKLVSRSVEQLNRVLRLVGIRVVRAAQPTRNFRDGLEHLKSLGFYPETVIDVGVLSGTPALYRVFPKSRFFLFEPQQEYEEAIKKLARVYAVSYEMIALGAKSGDVDFFAKPRDPGASSSFSEARTNPAMQKRVVPMRRLDEVLAIHQLGRACLLKIDVEGYELSVLEGATALLDGVDVIVLEVRFIRYYQELTILHEVIIWMSARGYFAHDLLDGGYRPQDGVLDVLDIVFLKGSSRVGSQISTVYID